MKYQIYYNIGGSLKSQINDDDEILLNNKKKTYTICGKTDGFGAQYQAIISGIAYCFYKNYKYIHTPIKTLEHNENVNDLNKFIGIPIKKNKKKIDIKKMYEPKVHWSNNPDKYYTKDVLNYIKKCYYSTKKPDVDSNSICIHIRRGDVSFMKIKKDLIIINSIKF